MDQKSVFLGVPAEPEFARVVRMTAASLAADCDLGVEDVEDVRMIAEEGFVLSCATAPDAVDVRFSLEPGVVAMDFPLGAAMPQDDSLDLVMALLDAVCDVLSVADADDGRTLHLEKRRAGDAHGE